MKVKGSHIVRSMVAITIDPELNVETELKYDFKTSFIYKYMKWTFQYTSETDWFQKTRSRKLFYTICQIAVLLFCWSHYGFECYEIVLHFNDYLKENIFSTTLEIGYILFNSFEIFGLLTLGHYIMKRYPSLIQDQIKCIKKLIITFREDASEVNRMMKKSESRVQDFVAVGAVIIMLMPIICNILLIANVRSKEKLNNSYSTYVLISSFVIWLLAMPFLFVTLFIVELQKIQLKLLLKKIELCQNYDDILDIFKSYTYVHQSIGKVNKAYSSYVIYLILSFGLEGSVGIYSEIEETIAFCKLPGFTHLDIVYTVFLTAYYVASVSFQFLMPILKIATVSIDQKKVAPMLLKSIPGQMDLYKVHRIAQSIDLLQRSEGVGYQIFNSPITKWKTVCWVLIGPIVKLLFSRLI